MDAPNIQPSPPRQRANDLQYDQPPHSPLDRHLDNSLRRERIHAKYHAARYREVHALLIGLEGDSAKAVHELQDFQRLLQDNYAMITRAITIPLTGGELLDKEFEDLERLYNAPDLLVFIFFDGRGRTLQGVDVITKIIEHTHVSDVVCLLDQHTDVSRNGDDDGKIYDGVPAIIEIIRTASNHEIPSPAHRSFTYHAIRAFRRLSYAPSFTAGNLVPALMNSILVHEETIPIPARDPAHNNPNSRHAQAILHFSLRPTSRTKEELKFIPFKLSDLTDAGGVVSNADKEVYKWGPLGPLPPGWEKRIDNKDSHWRPYYYNSITGTSYWTRPWHSIKPHSAQQKWWPFLFAAYATKALERKIFASTYFMTEVMLSFFRELRREDEEEYETSHPIQVKEETAAKSDSAEPSQVEHEFEPEASEQTFQRWASALLRENKEIIMKMDGAGFVGLPEQFQAVERHRIIMKITDEIHQEAAAAEESY
ncbi:hypothetical protein BDZ45DRAFT_750221 [Acephala macrosclerotiorum]|nr:hypothetical protein BDZ45DRAFT_750221 [Acephala macrosclerotiorum]